MGLQTWQWNMYSGVVLLNFIFQTSTTPSGSWGASSLVLYEATSNSGYCKKYIKSFISVTNTFALVIAYINAILKFLLIKYLWWPIQGSDDSMFRPMLIIEMSIKRQVWSSLHVPNNKTNVCILVQSCKAIYSKFPRSHLKLSATLKFLGHLIKPDFKPLNHHHPTLG